MITGLGIVSPIGVGVDAFWRAALAGQSGIGRPTLFDASNLPPECRIVGEVRDFDPRDWMPSPAWKMAGRFSQFAVAAAKMATDDARLDMAGIAPDRVQVAIGSAMSGLIDVGEPCHEAFQQGREPSPWMANEYTAHAATSHIAIATGTRGQAVTMATACAAGLDAMAWAADQVRRGDATAVIAGATEAPLSPFALMICRSAGVLSKWSGAPELASRPFELLRSGLVLAEGCAVVVVEDEECALARGARPYARIASFASATEGTHIRRVDPSGATAAYTITTALAQAQLRSADIDYISAHGNSIPDYDAAETAALKRALGRHAWNVPVSSIKSMCGQPLSAGSAMQVVATCLTLRDQALHPTINHDRPDPSCDLDYVPNRSRRARVRHALVHSHSLGGSHSVMILSASSS
ncbi:MAG: beta-ketoacyl-[acyl-carrier-protein] synthase family protein [Candidatus Rokubacteria bacterium]|nr:beta-ketoacyl-[acyl-carrier-protein] synthase family protein [Candidatus Rokubacteria bacterium]